VASPRGAVKAQPALKLLGLWCMHTCGYNGVEVGCLFPLDVLGVVTPTCHMLEWHAGVYLIDATIAA
jgi:hypothetical protein